jgi:Leucine-rich repeat (LRR) protein
MPHKAKHALAVFQFIYRYVNLVYGLICLIYLTLYDYILGSIPSTIGSMSSLSSLNIFYNSLNGTLPATIGHLSNLQSLYIEGTCLQGTIPTSVGCLTKLSTLTFVSNSFTGTL